MHAALCLDMPSHFATEDAGVQYFADNVRGAWLCVEGFKGPAGLAIALLAVLNVIRSASPSLMHAVVTSRIDYCNAVLFGVPATVARRLQGSTSPWCPADSWRPPKLAYNSGNMRPFSQAHRPSVY